MKSNLSDNTQQESDRFFKRSIVCAIVILVFFVLIVARLIYLQVIEHHFYVTQSKHNIISIVPVKPDRGLIYDRNGVLLAKNVPVYSLDLIPGRVKHLKQTISELTPIVQLTSQDIQVFYRSLKHYRRFQAVPVKDQLTETQLDKFYVNQYRFPGVIVQTNMMREYPLGKSTSDVVGYVGRVNAQELSHLNTHNYTASDYVGKAGIEEQEEKLLHGKIGNEEAEINAAGKIVRILKVTPPQPGENIYLTIDSKLQAYAEKALGHNNGAIVAIQPSTGQVLALATKPNFNPNLFVNGMANKTYQRLLHAPGHPLFDRAIRGLYAPGSTIKPFIAASALSDGVIKPQYKIFDPGWFRLPHTTHIFHDWKHTGHGWVNVYKAIIVSCDTFFYTLAAKLGIHRLDQAVDQFGFGHRTGIDLPGEKSGLNPSPHWKRAYKGQSWFSGDTVQSGIGQGYMLVTPLQLAYATSIMAERGLRFKPTLLLKTKARHEPADSLPPKSEPRLVLKNSAIWKLLIASMHGVIMNPLGTAYAFGRDASYSAAAKTGTAQVFGHNRDEERSLMSLPKKLRNNHLFIVFAPIHHPKIAMAIVIEHASFADRIARRVIDYYFHELKEHER